MMLKKVTLTAALVLAVACAASTAALASHPGRGGQEVRVGPAARAPAPVAPLKEGTVHGVVERVVDDGAGKALLLTSAVKVPVDDRTEYLAETGLDAAVIALPDVLGKEVDITLVVRDGKAVAISVWVPRFNLRSHVPGNRDAAEPGGEAKPGVVYGVVKRVVTGDQGGGLLLEDGTWVAIDGRTKYRFMLGFDGAPAQLADVMGAGVTITTEKRGGKAVAAVVMIDVLPPYPWTAPLPTTP
jgi:hypothetical protein